MNIQIQLKIISLLVIIIACFMIIPAMIALYCGEEESFNAFAMIIVVSCVLSLSVIFRLRHIGTNIMSTRDGFIFVTMSWIIAAFIGALPLIISGSFTSFTDAYFEIMSGFTTTGASILTDIESMPKSILFWRSLTHWLGGMGIVVLTVAILPILGIGGLQLIKAEAPGPTVDKLTPRITETAKILWFIYIGFTITETVLLYVGGMDLFDALTHTFSTLATGGFSTKNASVGHFNSAYIDGVITLFMVIAGINFTLHFRLLTGRFSYLTHNTEFKVYILIFLVSTSVIALNLSDFYDTAGDCLRFASFQAASILTTTGFVTSDYEQWPFLSQMVLFIMMFIGGSSGSTGGGIKVIRIVTLLKQGFNEMKFLLHPRGIFILRISGNIVRKNIVYAISGFFFLYIFMLLLISFVVATAGNDIETSFSTALATLGNIGPGFGNIGPTESYAFYPDYIKWVLCLGMLVGRLELYTVLVLFTPRFWNR